MKINESYKNKSTSRHLYLFIYYTDITKSNFQICFSVKSYLTVPFRLLLVQISYRHTPPSFSSVATTSHLFQGGPFCILPSMSTVRTTFRKILTSQFQHQLPYIVALVAGVYPSYQIHVKNFFNILQKQVISL